MYEDYSDRIFSYIFMLVKQNEVAEDLTQETFIKVYHSLSEFKGESQVYTWLIKIARNVSIDYLRRKNRFRFFSFENFRFESKEPTPPEIAILNESVKTLYNAMSKLKLDYQEVLILRKIKDFSVKESASILGWDETKVKNTTSRAIAALRLELEKRGELNEDAI